MCVGMGEGLLLLNLVQVSGITCVWEQDLKICQLARGWMGTAGSLGLSKQHCLWWGCDHWLLAAMMERWLAWQLEAETYRVWKLLQWVMVRENQWEPTSLILLETWVPFSYRITRFALGPVFKWLRASWHHFLPPVLSPQLLHLSLTSMSSSFPGLLCPKQKTLSFWSYSSPSCELSP